MEKEKIDINICEKVSKKKKLLRNVAIVFLILCCIFIIGKTSYNNGYDSGKKFMADNWNDNFIILPKASVGNEHFCWYNVSSCFVSDDEYCYIPTDQVEEINETEGFVIDFGNGYSILLR